MNIGMAYFAFGGEKGTARVASELCLRFARKGHDVHFHAAHVPSQSPHNRISFEKVSAINSFNVFGLTTFAFAGKRSLARCSHDITHSHGNLIGSDVITAHSCHKAAVEVARAGGAPAGPANLGVADYVRLFLERKNYRERRFKRVIAVSSGVKRELMECYGLDDGEITVIPNGVDLGRFDPGLRHTVGSLVKKRLGIRQGEFVILFVANEFHRKGLTRCIDAVSLLQHRDVRLVVVGNDRSDEYMRQADRRGVRERVLFCGPVREIENYYAASDIFLLPTFYEAFSLATLEAAASGLPLLMTKVHGTDELMEDGSNGFFVRRDADDIARHLDRLVNDEPLRLRLGNGARRSAEKYGWDTIADRTLQVYEEIR